MSLTFKILFTTRNYSNNAPANAQNPCLSFLGPCKQPEDNLSLCFSASLWCQVTLATVADKKKGAFRAPGLPSHPIGFYRSHTNTIP